MTVLTRLALALVPALLLGAYAAFPALAFLPWVALVPWIVLYADDRKGPVSWGYFAVGAYAAWLLQYTQAWRFGWYAPFAMGLACLPWCLPFAPVLSRLHHRVRVPRMLAVALAWTATEWIRSTFTVSHFDLYGIGYSQARFPAFVQIADLTGSYGVSFLVAAGNGWIAGAVLAMRDRGPLAGLRSRPVVRGAIALATALAAVGAYGAWRLTTVRHDPGPRLALVQPNTPHTQQNMVGVHLTQLLMTARRVPAEQVDLIVWPENAIVDNIAREGAYLDDLAWVAESKGAWFVVGAQGKSAEHPGRTTNSAWLIDPEGGIRGRYDKQVLFPWGEYIPADGFLGRWAPAVQRTHRMVTRMGWGFQPTGIPGDRTEILEMPWRGETLRFAALICVENTFPPLPAEAGRGGADFFLNITSEGTVGGPVQEQLLRIAMFRAIENRMSYVRVGNTGISGVIDAVGRPRAILRGDNGNTINTPGVLLAEVPLSHSPRTVYSRSRDAFAHLCVLATAVLLAASFRRPRGRVAAAALAIGVLVLPGCSAPPPLGTDPAGVDAALERGRGLLGAGQPGPAVPALAAACATEEGCRIALPALVAAYDRGKRDDDAVVLFGEIATRHPALAAEALSYRAVFRERILDLRGARTDYERSLELDPTARVHGRLGNLLMRMDRPDEALVQFREGLRLDPADSQLRYLLGRALRIHGRLDEAERVLQDLVRDVPTQGNAWTNLGRIRWKRGDDDGALEAFRTAIRVEPAIIEARFMLAKYAFRAGDLDTVEAMIRQIREIEAGLGRGPRRE